ncbi:type IV toxin-antitoxin system AbiEi family antitoxin domain-containing protein [Gordonia sp. FQ]|uniref:type IV toxin-antitoxin system AbiEi family antitoxin domain-containing protein n=1 Tax=Gordonia sp. FQ TaxID=3446634 RepID=UPI003F8384CE
MTVTTEPAPDPTPTDEPAYVTALAELLGRQEGVATRAQLLAAGVPSSYLRRKLRRGEWTARHHGVYVTHNGPLTWVQRAWAATLATAPSALSHECAIRAAGGPIGAARDDAPIHLAVADHRHLPARDGMVVHYRGKLGARALLDAAPPRLRVEHAYLELAAEATDETTAIAHLTAAVQSRLTRADKLLAALESRPTLPRRAFLRSVLGDVAKGTCSVLEHAYLTGVERAHGLPEPVRQAPTGTGRPGFRDLDYPEWGLIIELDGRLGHDDSVARTRDFERDLDAAVGARRRTVRLCYAQATTSACATAVKIGALLRQGGWPGTPAPCTSKTCPARPLPLVP